MRVHPAYPSRTSLSRLLRARLAGVAGPIKEKNQRQIAAGKPVALQRGANLPAFAKAAAGNLGFRLVCQPKLQSSAGWSGRWESNPRHSAWEADVLPLNYARKCNASCTFWQFLTRSLPGRPVYSG